MCYSLFGREELLVERQRNGGVTEHIEAIFLDPNTIDILLDIVLWKKANRQVFYGEKSSAG